MEWETLQRIFVVDQRTASAVSEPDELQRILFSDCSTQGLLLTTPSYCCRGPLPRVLQSH